MSTLSRATTATQALIRGLSRQPALMVQILLIVGVAATSYWRVTSAAPTSPPQAADLFMQSVATDDGELGWHQLCPSVQSQVPREAMVQYVLAAQASHSEDGLTMSVEYVGERPRIDGGTFRFYVATARGPEGASGQKTFVVITQPSGCVEAVE